MNHAPIEDDVRDALHRRVDPLQCSPLSVTDVRRHARRIQRRRTLAAGAAVAAVLAIAIPVGLAMNGPGQRTEIPPVTRTPDVVGTVRIDPRSATLGEGPGVPLIDTTGPTLTAGGEPVAIPKTYDEITPYRDGWLAVTIVDGLPTVEILDASFVVLDSSPDNSRLTVSPERTRVAWAFHNGDSWSIVNNDVAGQELERPWTKVSEGPDGSTVGTIGFVSEDEVLAFQLDERTGTIATLLVDGTTAEPLPWIEEAVSAAPATGMIAARATLDDGRSCGATFDGRTRATEPLWTDCDRTLSDFNSDGTLLAAFPGGDPNSGGNPRGVSILDASTGQPLVEFEVTPRRGRPVGVATQVVWEDDDTLLATYVDGDQQYVVRLGLDGTVERVAGPVTADLGTVALRLTPGTVD